MAIESPNQRETDALRGRVRLFLQVMLVIDLSAYASDFLGPLLSGSEFEVPQLPLSAKLVRWGFTLVVALAWGATKFVRLGRLALITIESGLTLAIVASYVHIGLSYGTAELPWLGALFSLFGVLLILTVRAALVPSPVSRTLLVGGAALAWYGWHARQPLSDVDPVVIDGLAFMAGAFSLALAVTSHVIYGLRARVRDALQLGQYTLVEKLGEGGMGSVYRARHSRLRRPTAVKLLLPTADSANALARFEAEVQLTAELTHPNTIRIYDYGQTEDGVFYYAMEHLDGATLAEVVELDGPQPGSRTIYIMEKVASALEEAHAAGLVHRDIKPANIMLAQQGLNPDSVKVLDFGLVRRTDPAGDRGVTREGALLGTPQYMAPEHIASEDAAGPSVDLYALGCVGYYLLAGAPPFAGGTLVETYAHHLHTEPEPPRARLARAGRLPSKSGPWAEDLEALVLQCMAKQPGQRPRSMSELLRRLRDCEQHGGWDDQQARDWWGERRAALAAGRAPRPITPAALTVAEPRSTAPTAWASLRRLVPFER